MKILAILLAMISTCLSQNMTRTPGNARIDISDISRSEMKALESHQKELNRVALTHGYDMESVPWVFEVLRCPMISKSVFFEFKSVERSEGTSKFIAVIPRDRDRVKLVPLWYRGLRSFGDPFRDPHNWAIFNETIAGEELRLTTDPQWLQLAMCYLGMVGESSRIITSEISGEIGELIKQRSLNDILPRVRSDKQRIRVDLYGLEDEEDISEWYFTFRPNGLLYDLIRNKQ